MPTECRRNYRFHPAVLDDFCSFFLGTCLGRGVSRETFVFTLDQKFVIKVEDMPDEGSEFQNVLELNVWNSVEHTPWAKWFAPVKWISRGGRVLMMQRTFEPPKNAQLPKLVPSFFTDLFRCNWGWLHGQWVCHDYGFFLMNEKVGLHNVRMKKADWDRR